MPDKRFQLCWKWLSTNSLILVVFGLSLAFFNQFALFDVSFNNHIDPVFYPNLAPAAAYLSFQQWVYGVLGCTVAGWGLLILFIVRNAFRNGDYWSWRAIMISILVWYTTDSLISWQAGVMYNIIFNSILLGMFIIPLGLSYKYFIKSHSS